VRPYDVDDHLSAKLGGVVGSGHGVVVPRKDVVESGFVLQEVADPRQVL
jgi:hypothetical protein